MSDSEKQNDAPIYEGKVYPGGTYMASMEPAAWPYMVNVVDNILRDAGSAAREEPTERARINELRREMFRIFPEMKASYIDDPVAAMDRAFPPRPSPRHTWDAEAKAWVLRAGGQSGPAINPRQSN